MAVDTACTVADGIGDATLAEPAVELGVVDLSEVEARGASVVLAPWLEGLEAVDRALATLGFGKGTPPLPSVPGPPPLLMEPLLPPLATIGPAPPRIMGPPPPRLPIMGLPPLMFLACRVGPDFLSSTTTCP